MRAGPRKIWTKYGEKNGHLGKKCSKKNAKCEKKAQKSKKMQKMLKKLCKHEFFAKPYESMRKMPYQKTNPPKTTKLDKKNGGKSGKSPKKMAKTQKTTQKALEKKVKEHKNCKKMRVMAQSWPHTPPILHTLPYPRMKLFECPGGGAPSILGRLTELEATFAVGPNRHRRVFASFPSPPFSMGHGSDAQSLSLSGLRDTGHPPAPPPLCSLHP